MLSQTTIDYRVLGIPSATNPGVVGERTGSKRTKKSFVYITLNTTNAFTYDHRLQRTRDPVRSPIFKL